MKRGRGNRLVLTKRNVMRLRCRNVSIEQLARELDCTGCTIRNAIHRQGVRGCLLTSEDRTEINRRSHPGRDHVKILLLRRDGFSMRAIGDIVGVSGQRVQQILKKHGIT